MTDPYIGQDILDQAAEAIRQGKKLEALAGILKCSPEHLQRLLDLKPEQSANMVQDDPDYLWRVDDAKEVL